MSEWDLAIKAIRTHGKYIAIGLACGLVIAFIAVVMQPPVYRAEMTVGPAQQTGIPSLSSFLPKTAADAPALQYFVERIDAGQSTDFTRFETLLKSPQILSKVLQTKNAPLPADNMTDLTLWMNKNLRIRPVGLTPYREITLKHLNGQDAVTLLSIMFKLTDREIRQNTKIKTNRRIAYLNDQLDTIQNPDHRDAVIALLKEQEQTAMMVSIDNEFAADIIEPPHLFPTPVAPKAIILFPALAVAGGFIGLMASGFRKALKA